MLFDDYGLHTARWDRPSDAPLSSRTAAYVICSRRRTEISSEAAHAGVTIDARRNFAQVGLWHYSAKALQFHAGLTNSAGNYHPWESKPWSWPMSLRPVLYAIDQQNVSGCGAQSCVKAEMLVATPAMWWVAVPVLIYASWQMVIRRDWRYAVALVGYCAGWLPWFADIDRQMYRTGGKKTIVLPRHMEKPVFAFAVGPTWARAGVGPLPGHTANTTMPAAPPETGTAKPTGTCSTDFLGQLHHCLHTGQHYDEHQAFPPPLPHAAS